MSRHGEFVAQRDALRILAAFEADIRASERERCAALIEAVCNARPHDEYVAGGLAAAALLREDTR